MNEQLFICERHIDRHPVHAAGIVQRLSLDDAVGLFGVLSEQHAARLARHARPAFMARVLRRLTAERAARLVYHLGVHTGVGLLRQLNTTQATQIIDQLPSATMLVYQVLLSYPEDSVGAWMDNQAVALSKSETVSGARKHLSETPDELATHVYVLDDEQRLLGVVGMAQLLRSADATPLSELWQPFDHRLSARSSLGTVKAHPGWFDSPLLPVVDNHDRFLGVLHFSRVSTPSASGGEAVGGPLLSDFMDTFWTTSTNILQGAVNTILPRADIRRRGEED